MGSYVEVEAAGPYVDVTVMGPYRTVPLEPRVARKLAREIEAAAEAIENPSLPAFFPSLEVVLSTQPQNDHSEDSEK